MFPVGVALAWPVRDRHSKQMAKVDLAALHTGRSGLHRHRQRYSRQVRTGRHRPEGQEPQLFLRLLRDRQWWMGTLVSMGGFVLQASALGLGSVLLVQSLLVTALLFALPINAHVTGQRVTRTQWMWAFIAGRVGGGDRHCRRPHRRTFRGALQVGPWWSP